MVYIGCHSFVLSFIRSFFFSVFLQEVLRFLIRGKDDVHLPIHSVLRSCHLSALQKHNNIQRRKDRLWSKVRGYRSLSSVQRELDTTTRVKIHT